MLVIDGPEKSGKSSTIRLIVDYLEKRGVAVRVRHLEPVLPDDRVYTTYLKSDVDWNTFVIWERSWVSEHIYARLLCRPCRLQYDPWLGEWLYGRAVQTEGERIILLGPSVDELYRRRDKTALTVDPAEERNMFLEYGQRFQLHVIENQYGVLDDQILSIVDAALERRTRRQRSLVPRYCGPEKASVVFVADGMTLYPTMPGSWLPFTGRYGTLYGRMLDDYAFQCGWVVAHYVPITMLRTAQVIVSTGKRSKAWVRYYIPFGIEVIELPHFTATCKPGAVEADKIAYIKDILNQQS